MRDYQDRTGRDHWHGEVALTQAAQDFHTGISISLPYENTPLDVTLFLYCRNQETTVIATLQTIMEAMEVIDKSFEVLVIDDASSDQSAFVIREFIEQHPHVPLTLRVNHHFKGVVENYLDGACLGVGSYYRLVHADNAESVETMVDALRAVGESDMLLPYFVSSMSSDDQVHGNHRFYARLINFFSASRINHYSDLNVHLRLNVLRWPPITRGPWYHAELTCRLLLLGFYSKQMPCRAVPQRHNSAANLLMLLPVLWRLAFTGSSKR